MELRVIIDIFCYNFYGFVNYIYIYIYYHWQTDCFVVSQLFNVARHVGRLKLGLKPAQFYVRLSIIPFSQQTNHVSSGIIRHYVVAFVCLHFCLTGYQRAQFIRRGLHYGSGWYIYIYIYIYIHEISQGVLCELWANESKADFVTI